MNFLKRSSHDDGHIYQKNSDKVVVFHCLIHQGSILHDLYNFQIFQQNHSTNQKFKDQGILFNNWF